MSLLIKNVLLGKEKKSIFIDGNLISEIGTSINDADKVIDADGKAALPGMINCHTHAGMTLMRGYADDMPLHEWLEKKIWPIEAKMKPEHVYWGAKLACLEMIKSGTTTFKYMYWHPISTCKAADEMGIRAAVCHVMIDMFDSQKREEEIKKNMKWIKEMKNDFSDRIIPALGPHAIYTVSKEGLEWCRQYSDEEDVLVHFHLAETEKEEKDCVEKAGKRPVPYLDSIGFLQKRLVACHGVWLNNEDAKMLAQNKASVSHNPTSNMKLAVGRFLDFEMLKNAGVNVGIGTDGCASNNNLDMFESVKFAALLQKYATNKQTIMKCGEVLKMASLNGAEALRINAGEIKEGKLADLILIDLRKPELMPNHNLISNVVYSANGSCVDTTICNGKVLMENRTVDGEKEIYESVKKVVKELIS